jgi:hypothetical protein
MGPAAPNNRSIAQAVIGQEAPVDLDIQFDQPRLISLRSVAALRRANCLGHSLNPANSSHSIC